jgi:hypothetical protein
MRPGDAGLSLLFWNVSTANSQWKVHSYGPMELSLFRDAQISSVSTWLLCSPGSSYLQWYAAPKYYSSPFVFTGNTLHHILPGESFERPLRDRNKCLYPGTERIFLLLISSSQRCKFSLGPPSSNQKPHCSSPRESMLEPLEMLAISWENQASCTDDCFPWGANIMILDWPCSRAKTSSTVQGTCSVILVWNAVGCWFLYGSDAKNSRWWPV